MKALVYSGIWIGVACAMQIAYTYILLGSEPSLDLMLCFGLAAIAVYNWQRLIKVQGRVPEINSERHIWIDRNVVAMWVVLALCAIGSFYLLLRFSDQLILSVFLLSWLAFFYTLPWFSGNSRKGLRELPYLKIFLIAICWAGITAFLPAMDADLPMDHAFVVSLERMLFITAITIPFDIRDIDHDSATKKTIPQVIGLERSIGLSITLCAGALLIATWLLYQQRCELITYVLLYAGYTAVFVLLKSVSPNRAEIYFTGFLDGTLVLIPALVWLSLLIN